MDPKKALFLQALANAGGKLPKKGDNKKSGKKSGKEAPKKKGK